MHKYDNLVNLVYNIEDNTYLYIFARCSKLEKKSLRNTLSEVAIKMNDDERHGRRID